MSPRGVQAPRAAASRERQRERQRESRETEIAAYRLAANLLRHLQPPLQVLHRVVGNGLHRPAALLHHGLEPSAAADPDRPGLTEDSEAACTEPVRSHDVAAADHGFQALLWSRHGSTQCLEI